MLGPESSGGLAGRIQTARATSDIDRRIIFETPAPVSAPNLSAFNLGKLVRVISKLWGIGRPCGLMALVGGQIRARNLPLVAVALSPAADQLFTPVLNP